MEISEIVESLKKSPIFAMSLGSKELFHSNFWAWLIEQDSRFVTVFFPDLDPSKVICVQREEGNRDITVWAKGNKAYIVENKLKSLPNFKQLQEYRDAFHPDNKKNPTELDGAVLVSVVPPSFNPLPDRWVYRTFRSVVEGIQRLIPNSTIARDKTTEEVAEAYCHDALLIDDLVRAFDCKLGPTLPTWSDTQKMEEVRFGDVAHKMKADQFAAFLWNEPWYEDLKAKAKPTGFSLECWSGFADKRGIIDIRFEKIIQKVNPRNDIAIGIQIQGDQYRLIAQRCGTDLALADALFQEFLQKGWFESYDNKSKTIFGHDTGLRQPYGQYRGHSDYPYCFVYQYYWIKDYSFAVLSDSIQKNLAEAIHLLAGL
jgi:hypothetical protein